MREFSVTLDGKEYAVAADGDAITVNEHSFTVEVTEGGGVLVDGIAYQVELAGQTATVDGRAYSLRASGLDARPTSAVPAAASAPARHAPAGANTVVAVMPGKIVRVLVETGQQVVEGDPVCVLEAMKMENELQARQAGTVGAIHVRPGDTVEKNQVLVELR